MRLSCPMPATVVVATPGPSQLKSPAGSLMVVLPVMKREEGLVREMAGASGMVTVPARVREELALTTMVLAMPEKVMSLLMTPAPVTVMAVEVMEVILPAPLRVATLFPPVRDKAQPAKVKS